MTRRLFHSRKASGKTEFWLLSPKINAEKIFFYLTILFLPTQLGRHFWPKWSYVLGIRVDYLSPTIYLTDIFIGLLFIAWFSPVVLRFLSSGWKYCLLNLRVKGYWTFITLGMVIPAGIILSKNPMAGWYELIKLLEFIFFGFYTAKNIGKKIRFDNIMWILLPGVIFESVLSIIQFINQSSLGGIFYFFGEREFNGQTPGIANASLNGELILRPYGTFPHPNVLAGYLIITMTIILSAISSSIKEKKLNIKKLLFSLSVIAGTVSIFLTMSRAAIILWFTILLIWLVNSLSSALYFSFPLLLAALFFSPIGYRFTRFSLGSQAVIQRENLIIASLSMIRGNFLLGTGLNNFLPGLPGLEKQSANVLYLQPVHNIYLLAASETGIFGLGFLLWFIVKTYGRIGSQLVIKSKKSMLHDYKFVILSTVLILGFFDHYFLTLQEGQLLLSFVFGLIWSKIKL